MAVDTGLDDNDSLGLEASTPTTTNGLDNDNYISDDNNNEALMNDESRISTHRLVNSRTHQLLYK
jgi:hypothetical protein